jgi:hypothetical protein
VGGLNAEKSQADDLPDTRLCKKSATGAGEDQRLSD